MTNQTPANDSGPERTLAAQARAIREKLGMTQAEVAREMSARGHAMRQSTIAKIEAAQRPVRVNEAVTLAAILRTDLADLLADPAARGRQDALAVAQAEERELLAQFFVAGHQLDECRAAHAAAEHAMREAASRVKAVEALYAEAQNRAAFLAAVQDERNEP